MSSCAWPDGCDAPKAGVFLCQKHLEAIGVMESNRFKATVVMSSDHAGINLELERLEAQLLHVIAHLTDARKVRNFVVAMRNHAQRWAEIQGVDMRGWMERTRQAR